MPLIEKYNTDENRRLWQKFLNSLGERLVVDGRIGGLTDGATKRFQAGENIRPDGIVGENTIRVAKMLGFGGFELPATTETPPAPVEIETKNLFRLNGVHPQLKRKVTAMVELAAKEGFTLRVVQGMRTFAEQDALFRQWRDGKDNDGDGRVDESDERVTRAAGGQSNHNYGVAADLAFVVNGKVSWDDKLYSNIGRWAKAVGLDWGGNWKKFKDLPHVELPNTPNWRAMLATHKKGGLKAVWATFGD